MPSIGTSLIIAAVIALLSGAGIGTLVHKIDKGKYEALELSIANAQAKALTAAKEKQAANDKITLDAALAEAHAQVQIQTVTQIITKEVVRHVQVHTTCITYGLVRVLDAAILATDPDSLPLPAGKSDDTCTALTPADLASSIVANYGTSLSNSEQLNSLEAAEVKLHQVK